MAVGKGVWDGGWRMGNGGRFDDEGGKSFFGGGMVDDNERVETRYGIVPCDTGSRWEGTVIVHSISLPLCQAPPPPPPFPYSLTRPINLYPFCLIEQSL
jgi:hypothetical protein